MPYITQDRREMLKLILTMMAIKDIRANGDLNYILYAYCKRNIKPSYNNYKNFIAELNECGNEIRRRLLAPYEDEKIKENGDIEE